MATVPSTPPRRSRIHTPDAPLFAPAIDKGRERKDRKDKEKGKDKEKPRAGSSTATKMRVNEPAAFAPSPPGSPRGLGLLSPGPERHDKGKDAKHRVDDPSAGPSAPSSSRFKKFKPFPAVQKMKNPFAPQESNGAESLPTPAKTPSRKRKYYTSTDPEVELDTTSRVLFPEPTASKSKAVEPASDITLESILGQQSSNKASTRRKPSRVDLGDDLFGSPDVARPKGLGNGASIEIYTDSNARIPEYDPSPDNPFIDHPTSTAVNNEKTQKLRKKLNKSKEEFETLKAGRSDGMVYTFRGMKFFRKFEEDNSGVLGGGPIQPRVLFPSARQTRSRGLFAVEEEDNRLKSPTAGIDDDEEEEGEAIATEDEADPFSSSFKQDDNNAVSSKSKDDVDAPTKVDEGDDEHKHEKKNEVEGKDNDDQSNQDDDDKDAEKDDKEKDEEKSEGEEEGEADEQEQLEKRPRAASVAPSVSSVASSNILSFGRRPRITKSVSNLSSSEYTGQLRRSKRLASVEPEAMPSIDEAGKTSAKMPKIPVKRGRSEDTVLEDTERWALGLAGGIRKRNKN